MSKDRNNCFNSSGWDRDISVSIADGSYDSAVNLSKCNLGNGVRLGLPLPIGMDIEIAVLDTSNMGDYPTGIARVDTSLNSIGDHSNIVRKTISQGVLDWKASGHLGNSVGFGIPRDSSNGQSIHQWT